ncbi:MAG TPA: tetratricopeptide repeat protein [Actinophytocola sp.]|uniref:tetratricopeptide repeat protein n=1 Tax=Actinophytocola sp. TaxID=1872138 RepID=UPI002DBB2894|nr:tetratricopeptide repeat protein [Actinophytocola sp.]HEU5473787.1 tetratricopeptide repeat protein [Actinophytocola sp.]
MAEEIARHIHHSLGEARALEGIGRTCLQHGDTITGLSHLRQALDIYRHLGVPEATQVDADLTTPTPNHSPARVTELPE